MILILSKYPAGKDYCRGRERVKEIPGIQCDNDWGGSSKHKVHRTAYFCVLENIKITFKNVSGEARMGSIFM